MIQFNLLLLAFLPFFYLGLPLSCLSTGSISPTFAGKEPLPNVL